MRSGTLWALSQGSVSPIGLWTRRAAQPRRLDCWTASARYQRNHQENDRDHKEHVRNPPRLTRDPAEAKNSAMMAITKKMMAYLNMTPASLAIQP